MFYIIWKFHIYNTRLKKTEKIISKVFKFEVLAIDVYIIFKFSTRSTTISGSVDENVSDWVGKSDGKLFSELPASSFTAGIISKFLLPPEGDTVEATGLFAPLLFGKKRFKKK